MGRAPAPGGTGIGDRATTADAQLCLAREYGLRTWAELADAADRAHDPHYGRLPGECPWRRAEAAVDAGDASPLHAAAYHGSREVADVLAARTGSLPEVFYIAASAGDSERLIAWFDDDGRLRPQAMRDRPHLPDVGWPPAPPVRDDPSDMIGEALSREAAEVLVRSGAPLDVRDGLHHGTPRDCAIHNGATDEALLALLRGRR